MKEHARDRIFLQVIKPQGLSMAQIKLLEQVLGQQAEQWAVRHLGNRTRPGDLRDRVTYLH
jgi:hypothetical protein